jgi:N-acetylglutamate synthase-like GNAT family acetyltransferase
MSYQVRRASADDAPGIARVMQASGLDDNPDLARIARVIPEHCTLAAVEAGEIVGFADSFLTCAADGTIRWEIDLLGVHPEQQGRGDARRLLDATIEEGWSVGAQEIRALVRSDNWAAQRAFAWYDFNPHPLPFYLYTAPGSHGEIGVTSSDAYLLPVTTLTYSGLWVEGRFRPAALQLARIIAHHYHWTLAGVLIPVDDLDAVRLAEHAGYRRVDEFDWWVLSRAGAV